MPVATIRCDEFHHVAVSVHGTRIEDTFATLEMTASTHPETGESTFLMWVHNYALRAGQVITVRLMDEGETTGEGKTIADLYPDDDSREYPEQKSEAEALQLLRAMPAVRDGYTFTLNSPVHPSYSGATQPDELAFYFHLLWHLHRPNRAVLSLNSATIDSIVGRTPSREHSREYILAGQSATLRVDA